MAEKSTSNGSLSRLNCMLLEKEIVVIIF